MAKHSICNDAVPGKCLFLKSSGRRDFIKKSIYILSVVGVSGCGGGGSASSNSLVATVIPPSIVDQPADQSVVSGDSAIFEVIADGTQPLTYQWLRNGVDIPGATAASYAIAATAPGDDAVFAVVVANSAGTVTSRDALLSVTALQITADSTLITVDSVQHTIDIN